MILCCLATVEKEAHQSRLALFTSISKGAEIFKMAN